MFKNRVVAVVLLTMGAMVATGAETKKAKPEQPYKALSAENADAPHILFVNVDHAVSARQLDRAMGLINAQYGFNIWTNAIDKSVIADVALNSKWVANKFGENAVLAVFIEKNPGGYNYLQAPGWWSMVNVSNLTEDSPSAELLEERIGKVCLRGLAMCSGVSATHDNRCVMYVGGFTLEGMDSVSSTFSPFAYQPIQHALRKLGKKAPFKRWD